MPSLTKAKEKALMALSVRKLVERGWLTALLGYLIKEGGAERQAEVYRYVKLQRTIFGALAITTYHASKCWPKLPDELARTASRLPKPQEAFSWLMTALSLASYACKLQASGNKVLIDVSPERVRPRG